MEEVKRLTIGEIEKLYEQYLDVLKEYLVLQNLSKKNNRSYSSSCRRFSVWISELQ